MNVARFDFSWGSQAYHTKTLENLREAMKQTKIMCATMLDTRGPEIGVELAPQDVSSFDPQAPKKPVVLEQGSRVTLTTDTNATASSEFLPVNNPTSSTSSSKDDVFVGHTLHRLGKFLRVLKVDEVDEGSRTARVFRQAQRALTVQVSNKGTTSLS